MDFILTMELADALTITISVVSLFLAGVLIPLLFFIYTRRVSMGNLEIQVRDMIRQANIEKQTRMIDYEAENDEHVKKFKNHAYASAIEWYLNSFEDACGLAIDGKIDKKRFKKTYNVELDQIIKNKKYAKIFMKNSAYELNEADNNSFNEYLTKGSDKNLCYYPKVFVIYKKWKEDRETEEKKKKEKAAKKQIRHI